MATTYDTSLTAAKDKVRFYLGDTSAPWLFTDEEIAGVIAINGTSWINATIDMCRAAISKFARNGYSKGIGPFSISQGEAVAHFESVMAQLKAMSARSVMPFIGGISKGQKTTMRADTDIESTFAWKRMHDISEDNDVYGYTENS